MRILDHLRVLQAASQTIKDNASTWVEYERIRKHLSARYLLEPILDIERLLSEINEIAGVYRVESNQLRRLIEKLSKAKSASFTDSSENQEVYVPLLSAHEVDLDLTENELEQGIKYLARKHSAITYMKVVSLLRSRVRDLGSNEEFVKKFSSEVWSSIKLAQQKNQADPKKRASSSERNL